MLLHNPLGEHLRARICEAGAVGGARVALPEAGFSQPMFAAARQYVERYAGRVTLLDDRTTRARVESEWENAGHDRVTWARGGPDPIDCGVEAMRLGDAEALVAGVATSSPLVVAQAIRNRASSQSWVAHGALMTFPSQRSIMIADCAVTPDPSPEQIAAIGQDMCEAFTTLTDIAGTVALVSYATGAPGRGSPNKMRAAATILRMRRPDMPTYGPIQLDAAVEPRVAEIKGVQPPVGGSSSVLIFPCLDAANGVLKALQWLGGADLVCVVPTGVARPIVNLSRGAMTPEIVGTIGAVAALAA